MLAKYPLVDASNSIAADQPLSSAATQPVQLPGPGVVELIHLARAVLLKSPDDLAALSEAMPALPANWIVAMTAERQRAEAESRFWSAAIAYLMATTSGSVANDG